MSSRRRIQRRMQAGGFTLIEMMVSVTLVVLIALSLWAAMRICISAWRRGTEAMDANQRQRATLDLVEKQISSISGLVPTLDLQTGAGQTPIFWGSSSNVQFVSLSPLHFRDTPGLTTVSYEIVPGKSGDYTLVQRETRYLGGDPTLDSDFAMPDEPATTILDRLTGAAFEYYDPGNADTPPQWISEWDPQEKMSLPAAISMTFSTRDSAGATQTHKLVIPVMAEAENQLTGFVDPFQGRGGGMGIPFMGGQGQPFPGRRGGGGQNQPPGGRRGGPGDLGPPGGRRGPGMFAVPPPPPGGRGGEDFHVPGQGYGREGDFE